MIEKVLVVVVTGIVVGMVNAVAGGGMLIGFPILLVFGLSALVSNATANVINLAGQVTSSIGYRSQLRKLPRAYFWLIVPSILGGVFGAYILRQTPNARFLLIAPALIIIAVILFAFQPYIKQRIYRLPEMVNNYDGPSTGIFILVFMLSIYGGYFGAGYGLVMLAILSLSKIKSIHEMNGLKNICAIAICLSATGILFNSHLINWHYGLTMAIGTAIGGYLGAQLAQRFPMAVIRYIVIIVGLATAIYLYSQSGLV
jgi:uncharacterized membrane protein YfcA